MICLKLWEFPWTTNWSIPVLDSPATTHRSLQRRERAGKLRGPGWSGWRARHSGIPLNRSGFVPFFFSGTRWSQWSSIIPICHDMSDIWLVQFTEYLMNPYISMVKAPLKSRCSSDAANDPFPCFSKVTLSGMKVNRGAAKIGWSKWYLMITLW